MQKEGYWFKSTLFEIEPGEDSETNPRCYGKQLAVWLKSKLEGYGYRVEDVGAEDWGRYVMCCRDPFDLWVACGNIDEYFNIPAPEEPPRKEDVVWHIYPVAEVWIWQRFFWKQLIGKADARPALDRLDDQLREILTAEKDIMLVDEQ